MQIGYSYTQTYSLFTNNITRWIRGREGKKYIDVIAEARGKGLRRRRLTVMEIEEYFHFTVEDYAAIWYPISFVLDPGFWNQTGPARLDYEQLRLATLAMICRIVVVLSTGRVQNRVLSNNIRIRILDSTCSNGEVRPWPSMVSSAGRPEGTSAWQEESPRYPEYKDSPMYQHLWARIEQSERVRMAAAAAAAAAATESIQNTQSDNQDEGLEVRGGTIGIHREYQHIRAEEMGGEHDNGMEVEGGGVSVVGREGTVGFVSLEKDRTENLMISGSEVQGLIYDVEAQLMNSQRKEVSEQRKEASEQRKDVLEQRKESSDQRKEVSEQRKEAQEDGTESRGKHMVEQEVIYETDEEESLADSENEECIHIPMSMGSEFDMGGSYHGLLTLDILGELDSYRRDDSELDNRILELLRPRQNEEDLRR